jgi:hypothetical protein
MTSPVEYKPKRKILRKEDIELAEILKGAKFLEPNKQPPIIPNIHLQTGLKLKVIMNRMSLDDIPNIINNEYKSFLCDTELFNWKELPDMVHNDIITKIKKPAVYRLYDIYLCKKLGNNINLISPSITETSTKFRYEKFLKKYRNTNDNFILIDIPESRRYNIKTGEEDELKDFKNIESIEDRKIIQHVNHPIVLANVNNKAVCFYSIQILNASKRYAIMNFIIRSLRGTSHYTFMVIDHEKRVIDYYDPHGLSNSQEKIVLVFNILKTLFKDYTIREFWRNTGMQITESIEKDEEGFCVVWGHMMMHLKLLNINMSIRDLENMFIEECATKNVSLYEVMLNYAYYMTRVIPFSLIKLQKFDKSL